MSGNSTLHPYLVWSKERLDEMDATLSSIEAKLRDMSAQSRIKAEKILADLRKWRDAFEANAKAKVEAGEAKWLAAKAELDALWNNFETSAKTYIETVGRDIDQQRSTFAEVATAQAKAWHEAGNKLHEEASRLAEKNRSRVDAAIAQMTADAKEAEARLQKLKVAGNTAWSDLNRALVQSRQAFDEANQKAWAEIRAAVEKR